MNESLNELYTSLGDDITRIMLTPDFCKIRMTYWLFLKELCEKLKKTFAAILLCQQQSFIGIKLI